MATEASQSRSKSDHVKMSQTPGVDAEGSQGAFWKVAAHLGMIGLVTGLHLALVFGPLVWVKLRSK